VRDGRKRFWKDAFNVYYHEEQIGECAEESCSITWQQDDGN
jgi:hypothetical protein